MGPESNVYENNTNIGETVKRDLFAEKTTWITLKNDLPEVEELVRYRKDEEDIAIVKFRTDYTPFHIWVKQKWNPAESMAELIKEYVLRYRYIFADIMEGKMNEWKRIRAEIRTQFEFKLMLDLKSDEELDFEKTNAIGEALLIIGEGWKGALEILDTLGAHEIWEFILKEDAKPVDAINVLWITKKKDYRPKWAR